MEHVEGRNAFVTGGASGIGLGMARAFVNAGMRVAIADLRPDHLDAAIASLNAGDRVVPLRLDVTDRHAYARVADEAERALGRVHVLCNNAGIGLAGPAKDATYEDWDWVLGVNLGGVVNGLVTMVPRMLKHGEGGHIVNTSSMSGIMPNPGTIQYTAAKAAVVAISEVLRTELAAENIGVSAFCPGPVQTQISRSGENRPSSLANTGYGQADKRRAANMNAHLWMDPDKVGELVLEGIRKNWLYIFTHNEFGPGIRERCEAIMAAVPKGEPNPEFQAAVPFLLHNPIFVEKRKA